MTDPMRGPRAPDLTCDEVRASAAAYVLYALEDHELAAVRAHLESCVEPHPEFAELGSVVPALALSVPIVEPPASLKGRLMAAAAADLETRRGATATASTPATATTSGAAATPATATTPISAGTPATATTPTTPTTPTMATTPIVVMPRRSSGPSIGNWAMRIAAVLAIVVLGGWNVLLHGQLTDARTYEQNVAAVLDVAGQDGSLTAVLTADGAAGPSGLAAVSAGGDVTLAMRDLPATSGGQVYEAWVIGTDGVPAPLGSFQVGPTGTAFFTGDGLPAEAGIVLALTLEPAPGATIPTQPIVSFGTATAAG